MFHIINKFWSHLLPVQIIRSSMKLWKSQIRWGGVGCMKFMKVRICVRLKYLIILQRKYSFKNLHGRKSLVFCKQGTRRSYGYTRSHVKIRLFSIPNFALDIYPSKMTINPRSKKGGATPNHCSKQLVRILLQSLFFSYTCRLQSDILNLSSSL